MIWYNSITRATQQPIITTTQNQPLIGIPFEENGKEVIRYFSEETQADHAVADTATKEALKLAGAWSDLSWEEMEQALLIGARRLFKLHVQIHSIEFGIEDHVVGDTNRSQLARDSQTGIDGPGSRYGDRSLLELVLHAIEEFRLAEDAVSGRMH